MNQTALDFLKLKQDCDQLIKLGQFTGVQKKLQRISASQIPKHHLVDMAALARRAHLWKLSLRWLHPVVRPPTKNSRSASAREVVEYALALQKAGALKEAEDLLQSVSTSEEPRVLLSRAYVCMARWDYQSAEFFLSQYLEASNLTEYEKLVGRVNWLASLVFLGDERAGDLLKELEIDLKRGNYHLLLSNCLEISAQYAVSKSQWGDAKLALRKAEDLVEAEKNLDALFIEKWKVVVSALEARNQEKLLNFRPSALEFGHWETLRDLDYYQAMLDPKSVWASWVYFGTPHVDFRKRLEKFSSFPEEEWISRSASPKTRVDPWFPGDREADQAHRCFVLLLRDFYRPLRAGEAFGALFPKEYYNPESSPNRIHQAMRRMRQWMEELNLPFQLVEYDGAYSIRIPADVELLCRKKMLGYDESEFLFHRYIGKLNEEFTAEDLGRWIGQSASTRQRLVKKAVEDGVLVKTGSGRFTTYKFSKLNDSF